MKAIQDDQDRGSGKVDISHTRLIAGLKRTVQQLRKDVAGRDVLIAKLKDDDKRSNVKELQLEVSVCVHVSAVIPSVVCLPCR